METVAFSFGLIIQSIKASSGTITLKEWAHTPGLMPVHTPGSGATTRCMARVYSTGLTVAKSIEESTEMTRSTAMGRLAGLMDASMLGNGPTGSSMALDPTRTLEERPSKGNG